MIASLLTTDQSGPLQFVGRQRPGGTSRIYGGQVFAQALMAATRTVDSDRQVHSAHAYFLRSGDENLPIDLEVLADFDGGSFSNRRVVARQEGKVILNLAASFQRLKGERAEETPAQPRTPGPDEAPSLQEYLARHGEAMMPDPEHVVRRMDAFDIRVVNGPLTFGENRGGDKVGLWFRLKEKLGSEVEHRGALAYFSDFTLLAAAFQKTDLVWSHDRVRMATIDHALWFHRPANMNDWILYVTEASWMDNDRAYCRGQFFTQDGRLIGSTSQEGLFRVV